MIKKELLILSIFIVIISFSQSVILQPHFKFGFSPDDVWFFSDFSTLGSPISKFNQVWQSAGIYHTPHIYYSGTLFTLFGFNFFAYHLTGLVFKILSIITFYLLVQIVFKNFLLSFISGLVFSFQYGSFGSMEMVSRTQDYLLLSGLNIFFIFFYQIFFGKLKRFYWSVLSAVVLFLTFIINPIRAYPILMFIIVLGIILLLKNRSKSNFYRVIRNFIIIFLPFLLFLILTGTVGGSAGNSATIIRDILKGNLQMLLAPFSSFGSIFLQNDTLKFLSSPTWNLNDFPGYFLGGPLIIFGLVTLFLSKTISSKPLKFFLGVFITNFLFDFFVFFAIQTGRNLPDNIRMDYDAYTFTPTAVLGGYICILSLFIFWEWLRDRQNKQVSSFRSKILIFYLLGIIFAAISIWLTWIVYSLVHIPMGIYGYSTIPSMGISAAVSSIMVLIFTKVKDKKHFMKNFAPVFLLLLLVYFLYSNEQLQTYLQNNIDYGNDAYEQAVIKDKFWTFLKDDPTPCNNFFFFKTTPNEQNGLNYSFIMLDEFKKWYNLYRPYTSKKPCPVAWLVSDEEKLLSSYTNLNNEEGFLYRNSDGENKFFPLSDFYAFKLKDRNIIDIKSEILKKIRPSI